MANGRPPKPSALKQRLGTARPDRERAPLAVLPASVEPPAVPKGLGTLGRRAWRSYWTLGNAWLNPRTDAQLLTRLCRAYDEEQALRDLIGVHGYLLEVQRFDKLGEWIRNDLVTNPATVQLRQIELLITRYEGLCGFTPSDRSRLGMAEVQRESKLDQLISSRNQRSEAAAD